MRNDRKFEMLANGAMAAVFLAFILFYFFANSVFVPVTSAFVRSLKLAGYKEMNADIKEGIAGIEASYNDSFYRRMEMVNEYGFWGMLFGKTVLDDAVPDRSVVKAGDGNLYYVMPKNVDTSEFAESFDRLHRFLQSRGIPFLYLQAPNKHMSNSADFPYGVMDYCNIVSKGFLEQLEKRGVPYIDMDAVFAASGKDERELFFVTDNHWNMDGAFAAFAELVLTLKNMDVGKKLINEDAVIDISNYERTTWEESYIGGIGKRVGTVFSDRRDDVELLFPMSEADYLFEKYGAAGNIVLSRSGSFKDVFFFPDKLEAEDIFAEKYTVFMGDGFAEENIINKNIKNGLKILIIKDSFAMPIAGFLSQCCERVRLVDIRNFAKPQSIEALVENSDFDIVLYIASPISMYYFPEMFSMPDN